MSADNGSGKFTDGMPNGEVWLQSFSTPVRRHRDFKRDNRGCAQAILSSCAESGLNIASRSDGVSISLQAEKQRSSVSANAVECWYIV